MKKTPRHKILTARIPFQEWEAFRRLMFQHFAISPEKVSDNFLIQCGVGLATQRLQEKIAKEKR
jgi:hypothetical protein